MIRRVFGLTVLLAAGACATYWPTVEAPYTASADSVFQCAKAESDSLGFKPTVWNARQGSLEAWRTDDSASARLSGEQRAVDILSVRAASSVLSVRSKSVIRRVTRTGWVEDGVPASRWALEAARTLLARCSSPAR